MNHTLAARFSDSDQAEKVIQELQQAGFTAEEVSYVSHDSSGSSVTKGIAAGGVSGALLGLAALAIPGIGPVVAAGPLAIALAGGGVGAATGGMLGALRDIGIPDEDAERYARHVEQGGTLVLVKVNDDTQDRALQILERYSPETVMRHEPAVRESGGWDPSNPHSDAPNYGEEGGSSQFNPVATPNIAETNPPPPKKSIL